MSNVTEDTDLVTQLTDKSDAAHTHPGGSGDMEKATYDPANKNAQLAALTDLAVDGNLSAAAQDAITKKHANTLDHSNALDHSNSLDHDGGAQDTTIATKETPTGSQAKVDSHAGAADPHTGYQKESEKGAASGYASLGAGGLVPISQLASGTPDGTKYVRDDGTLVTPPGGSEAFPVGSVFLAVVATNPATLLGYGTWSAIAAGRVLVGLDSGDTDFDTAEETGGAKTINLAHTHDAHTAGRKGGTTNPQDIFNAPVTHASNLSATQSVVQPYFEVYMWKRTA